MPNGQDQRLRIYEVEERLRMRPFFIKHRATDKHFYMDFHAHPGYEIYIFQQGSGNFLIEDRIFPLAGGDILLISEFESHKSAPSLGVDCSRSVVNFLPELLLPQAAPPFLELFHTGSDWTRRHLRVSGETLVKINALLTRMEEENRKRADFFEIGCSLCLNELLLEIARLIRSQASEGASPIPRSSVNSRVEQVIRYLSERYSEPIKLKQLAEMIYVSPYYLCHLFKETTGVTISEYLIYTRIRQSKRELALTEYSIAEIASRVGFNTLAHFGQTFKMLEGMTPRDYRKQMSRR
ncbi:AraC family transcriptional regulator [Paenibacillus doosanensis]|uniref:HTH-type transcriptional activator RhaR n=1 Tax=Paenibacillus konkukensis TaxID=2020716 RepID=A0ABY4RTG0_9BACL|nr:MULTISPECIES: AraC family transcriptional regulator [Paenibacillus]MCS7464706.1 AraC family transcriptional regulator [Paenibacillus doosanensis]UQZ85854.1 HTH-type transcriptional activator RhaR [Paenibacillus konkukensis]